MIEVRNIRKSFGSLEVLKGIDLDIRKGEVVSIVGPSGAGKTTLLQIMGTLDKPDSGSVRLDGVAMESLSRKEMADFRNRRIGSAQLCSTRNETFPTSRQNGFG